MNRLSKRFRSFQGTRTGMLILASVATFSSQPALAAVVDSGPVSISVPATFAGIYFNIVTGVTGGSPGAVPGWDVNPYLNTSALSFFWDTVAGGVGSSATVYAVLAPGATIDGTNTFIRTTATAATAGFTGSTQPNAFLGVHFTNESTGVINFGWIEMSTTAGTGFPLTIVRYAYENTGAAITIPPITPVRLQSFDVD